MRITAKKIFDFNGRTRVQTINTKPSKTQQQFAADCDINNIINRYKTTGEFTHLTSKQGAYRDFSSITDYQDMLDTVQYAQNAFNALPADIRLRFQNDPAQLLLFVQDEANYDEGVKLGLVQPRENAQPNIQRDETQNDATIKGKAKSKKDTPSKTPTIAPDEL